VLPMTCSSTHNSKHFSLQLRMGNCLLGYCRSSACLLTVTVTPSSTCVTQWDLPAIQGPGG
jgi:hypothetical protein